MKKARWGKVVLAAVLALLLIAGLAHVFRGAIVAAFVAPALAERGVVCEPLDLAPSWDLSTVEVGETRCEISEGAASAVGLPTGATVGLEGTSALRSLDAETVVVELRGGPALGGLAGAMMMGGPVPPPLQDAISSIAEASGRDDVPRVRIDTVSLLRESTTLTLRELALDPVNGLHATVAQVRAPASRRGRLAVAGRMSGVDARATPSDVEITGRLEVELQMGPIERDRTMPFRITGTALDTETPRYRMHVEGASRLRELRERVEGLRERVQERRDGRTERRRAVRERLDEVRERLGGGRLMRPR